jgi:hypothetical protein
MNKLDTVFETSERVGHGRTAKTRGLWDAKAKSVVIEHTFEPVSAGEFTETLDVSNRVQAHYRAKIAHDVWVTRLELASLQSSPPEPSYAVTAACWYWWCMLGASLSFYATL